jgi:hypothetical protein
MTTFRFTLYRFIGPKGQRSTEVVRDLEAADGMRSLVDQSSQTINACRERVSEWAAANGITVKAHEPFPSTKYPGKVWMEFRFGGLTL